jgi:hypothetical protein
LLATIHTQSPVKVVEKDSITKEREKLIRNMAMKVAICGVYE